MSPLDQQRSQDDAFDGALACALAAMRRDGDARPVWTDAIARRDHSSPAATTRDDLRAPRTDALIGRRTLGLAPAETAATAAGRAALSYWARLGDGHPPPRRRCSPAVDRPLLTPWLFIGAFDRSGGLAVDYAGDAVDDFAGRPLAGGSAAPLAANADERATLDDALRMLRATGGPTLFRGAALYADDRIQGYEIALAPLLNDDGAPTMALGALGLSALRAA